MTKKILGVIVGYGLWTVMWLGGNALFFSEAARTVEDQTPFTAPGPLASIVLLSILCSVAAGLACAAIGRSLGALIVLGVLLLVTGIGVQASVWTLMPVWYHLTFLGLLIPVVLLTGRQVGWQKAVE